MGSSISASSAPRRKASGCSRPAGSMAIPEPRVSSEILSRRIASADGACCEACATACTADIPIPSRTIASTSASPSLATRSRPTHWMATRARTCLAPSLTTSRPGRSVRRLQFGDQGHQVTSARVGRGPRVQIARDVAPGVLRPELRRLRRGEGAGASSPPLSLRPPEAPTRRRRRRSRRTAL